MILVRGLLAQPVIFAVLDKLASAGLRIAIMYAGPACQPTRTMLMASSTGHSGPIEVHTALEGRQRNNLLSRNWAIIPELLQDAGYATFMTGKWDLGWDEGYGNDDVALTLEDIGDEFYVTDHYTNKMLEYLSEAEEGEPWFAYMPYTAPHWPLQLPDDWLDKNGGRYEMGYDELRQ